MAGKPKLGKIGGLQGQSAKIGIIEIPVQIIGNAGFEVLRFFTEGASKSSGIFFWDIPIKAKQDFQCQFPS